MLHDSSKQCPYTITDVSSQYFTEKAELEAERVKLMEDVTANKRKMQELEDNLLYKLTSTQVSMLRIVHTQ